MTVGTLRIGLGLIGAAVVGLFLVSHSEVDQAPEAREEAAKSSRSSTRPSSSKGSLRVKVGGIGWMEYSSTIEKEGSVAKGLGLTNVEETLAENLPKGSVKTRVYLDERGRIQCFDVNAGTVDSYYSSDEALMTSIEKARMRVNPGGFAHESANNDSFLKEMLHATERYGASMWESSEFRATFVNIETLMDWPNLDMHVGSYPGVVVDRRRNRANWPKMSTSNGGLLVERMVWVFVYRPDRPNLRNPWVCIFNNVFREDKEPKL